MATAKQFEDLGVWQDARVLVKEICAASKQRAFYRDIGLRDSAASLSRRLAQFIRYLEAHPSNTRVRKPAKC